MGVGGRENGVGVGGKVTGVGVGGKTIGVGVGGKAMTVGSGCGVAVGTGVVVGSGVGKVTRVGVGKFARIPCTRSSIRRSISSWEGPQADAANINAASQGITLHPIDPSFRTPRSGLGISLIR